MRHIASVLGLFLGLSLALLAIVEGQGGSLVSFAHYGNPTITNFTCGPFASYHEAYQNSRVYPTFGMYICGGGQGTWDHQPMEIKANGMCNSEAGTQCDPEFSSPVLSTLQNPWRHHISLSATHRRVFAPFPLNVCVTSGSTEVQRTINGGVVWSTDPVCNPPPPSCPDVCLNECPPPPDSEVTDCEILGPTDYCAYASGCSDGEAYGSCCILWGTPILIDLDGKGFHLTDVDSGVLFAIAASDVKYQVSWTRPGTSNAWLVLDRNGNGRIDNGLELFGNFTEQPDAGPGEVRNGFRALAEFDKPEKGGNGDGVIDARDAVFSSLMLWTDRNHNGEADAGELQTLGSAGITALEFGYTTSRRRDRFGNTFRYRAEVHSEQGAKVGRWAHDVFLKVALPGSSSAGSISLKAASGSHSGSDLCRDAAKAPLGIGAALRSVWQTYSAGLRRTAS